MPQRPSLSQRLRILRTALSWAWSGRDHLAREIQAQVSAGLPAPAGIVEPPSVFLDEAGTDTRWELLVGTHAPVSAVTTKSKNLGPALAWQLAWVMAAPLGPRGQDLFWSAAAAAALQPAVPLPGLGRVFGPPEKVHAARRSDLGKIARALVSVFPEEAGKAPPWESAWEQWHQAHPAGPELAVGAMLDALARPTGPLPSPEALQALRLAAPVPWAIWLLLLDDASRMDQALATGGPSAWPGVSAPWRLPDSMGGSTRHYARSLAGNLQRLAAPPPPDAKGRRCPPPPNLAGLLDQPMILVDHAANLAAHGCVDAMGRRGVVFPESASPTYLERVLIQPAPYTAMALIRAGARLPPGEMSTRKGHLDTWSALFESPLVQWGPPMWRDLERELWDRTNPQALSQEQSIALVFQAAAHPLAQHTLARMFKANDQMTSAILLDVWRAMRMGSPQAQRAPWGRSVLTMLAHNPHWSLEDKQGAIARAFAVGGKTGPVCADTLLDDFSTDSLPGAAWKDVAIRPVTALTWALVHAPAVVPDLLARSTPSQIQSALDSAGAHMGWLDSDHTKPAAAALGVTHSWAKFRPAWAQAALSVDVPVAMAALAGHPQTLADLSVARPFPQPRGQESVNVSGLNLLMMLFKDSHVATHAIKAVAAAGAPVPLPGPSARVWMNHPRDVSAIIQALLAGNLLEAPVSASGGTALAHAIASNDLELAGALLDAGASLDTPDAQGTTPKAQADLAGGPWPGLVGQHTAARMERVLPQAPADAPLPRARM